MSFIRHFLFLFLLVFVSVSEAAREPRRQAGEVVILENGERYFLIKELGAGAIGTVFRASKPGAKDEIAIKFFSPVTRTLDLYADVLQGFENAKRMNNPALISFRTEKLKSGELVVLMPVGDRNLNHVIHQQLTREERLALAVEIYSLFRPFLQDLVLHGFNFGDLKPENMVRVSGEWKVIDFDSIEKIGAVKEIFTSTYASAEVRTKQKTKWTSDAFSVGRILSTILLRQQAPDDITQRHKWSQLTLQEIYKTYPEFSQSQYRELRQFIAASLAEKHDERANRLQRIGFGNSCQKIY